MTFSRPGALALLAGLALAATALAGCGSSDTPSPESLAGEAAESQATADASPQAAARYCEPLAAAYAIKPASGEPASDAQLAAFGKALIPAADAAAADGRPDLADLFTLLSQVNAAPDSVTQKQTDLALTEAINYSDEVKATCGIDMLA